MYWRGPFRETFQDPEDFNQIASALKERLTGGHESESSLGGTELDKLIKSGRLWGQIFYSASITLLVRFGIKGTKGQCHEKFYFMFYNYRLYLSPW
jgi:hypothetical protein